MKIFSIFFIGLIWMVNGIFAQTTDSIQSIKDKKSLPLTTIILPSSFITYGLMGLQNSNIQKLNQHIKSKVEYTSQKTHIDDYSQYVPMASVYVLNSLNIKGLHSFKERTQILITAYLLMGTSVTALKYGTHIERPDGSTKNSFPSGHTATAFMGATFLHQEFKDRSVWYGVAGYTIATGTGFLRMYNNRHWFSDIVTGAGIGILSTQITYHIQPWLTQKLSIGKKPNTSITPYFTKKTGGITYIVTLN